jgi:hypothetical protein
VEGVLSEVVEDEDGEVESTYARIKSLPSTFHSIEVEFYALSHYRMYTQLFSLFEVSVRTS